MSTLQTQIKVVNEKLQQLLKRNVYLQKQNELLSSEVNVLKEKEKGYKATIETMNQKMNILQAAGGSMSKENQKNFENQLDRYIKEIEKCINILSE